MDHRKFGTTGRRPSILGFGMMRLKRREDGSIDEQWAVSTVRDAIDQGVSYLDTAYNYGDSERVTGLCLKNGYRDKVTLAAKLPVGRLTCEDDFEYYLQEELRRLDTDHIDVYLLHSLNKNRWENFVCKYNVLAHAEKAKREGKIRHIGFSFHDTIDVFKEILNGYDHWEVCQIQLNYMDICYQAGLEGLRLAHEKGLAVVIMEPLRGGRLAEVPPDVQNLLPKNPVESALDFLWNMPEIHVVLSGMSETEQVRQNICYANRAFAGMLSDQEVQQTLNAGIEMQKHIQIPCTSCGYCSICPEEIPIAEIFRIYNRLQMDGDIKTAETAYEAVWDHNASHCRQCGLCTEQCPQQIPIYDKLAKLHRELT